MLSEKKPSERWSRLRNNDGSEAAVCALLDELHAAIRALQLRDGAKAEAGEGDLTFKPHRREVTKEDKRLFADAVLGPGYVAPSALPADALEMLRGFVAEYSQWDAVAGVRIRGNLHQAIAALEAERARCETEANDRRKRGHERSCRSQDNFTELRSELAAANLALTAEQRAHEETKALMGDVEINANAWLQQLTEATETIATLTRERDEANAFAAAETEHANKWNKFYVDAIADRDRLQGELAKVAESELALHRSLSDAKLELVSAERELASLRSQSCDGLREAVEAYAKGCDADGERGRRWSNDIARHLRDLLAANPAPTNGHRPIGPGEESGHLWNGVSAKAWAEAAAENGHNLTVLHSRIEKAVAEFEQWQGHAEINGPHWPEFRDILSRLTDASDQSPVKGNPPVCAPEPPGLAEGTPGFAEPSGVGSGRILTGVDWASGPDGTALTIGAHTMTVAEWEALAKERDRLKEYLGKFGGLNMCEAWKTANARAEKLSTRIEKAVGMLRDALSARIVWPIEMPVTLTCEQAKAIAAVLALEVDDEKATVQERTEGDFPKTGHTSGSDTTEADWCVPPGSTEQAAMVPTMGTVDDDADRAVRGALNDRMGPTHRMMRASTVTDPVERIFERLEDAAIRHQYHHQSQTAYEHAIRIVREEAAKDGAK